MCRPIQYIVIALMPLMVSIYYIYLLHIYKSNAVSHIPRTLLPSVSFRNNVGGSLLYVDFRCSGSAVLTSASFRNDVRGSAHCYTLIGPYLIRPIESSSIIQ